MATHSPLSNHSLANVQQVLPATPLQSAMIADLANDRSKHIVTFAWDPKVLSRDLQLDEHCVQNAWTRTIHQHDALRTRFVFSDGELFQVIFKNSLNTTVTILDWSPIDLETTFQAFLAAEKARGFSIDENLCRLTFARVAGTNRAHIILTIHQSLCDEWSFRILVDNFRKALAGDADEADVTPILGYFKEIQEREEREPKDTETYWRAALENLTPSTPIVFPVTAGSHTLDKVSFGSVSYKPTFTLNYLEWYAASAGTTVSNLLGVAWALVLRHYLRRDDVIFGTAVWNRHLPVNGMENMVGMLMNTIPVRVLCNRDVSVSALLESLQVTEAKSLQFSHAGLVDMQRWAGIAEAGPLFHTEIIYKPWPSHLPSGDGEELPLILNELFSNKDDMFENNMTLIFQSDGTYLRGTFHFDGRMMNEDNVRNIVDTFDNILSSIVRSTAGSLTVHALDALSSRQKELFYQFGIGHKRSIARECLHNAFEEHALIRPNETAVENEGVIMTYGELDARANVLAHRLRSMGVVPGVNVGLLTTRSIEMVVGIIAILKAGGAYVPAAADFPKDRIAYMFTEANCNIILTLASQLKSVPNDMKTRCIFIDDVMTHEFAVDRSTKPDELASRDDTAYVIFTSGTTGNPKGVLVPHRGVTSMVQGAPGNLGAAPGLRVLQFMAVAFDGAVAEIFAALSNGATLVLRGPDLMTSLKTVNIITITPTGLQQMDPNDFPHLQVVFVVGEACPVSLVEKWSERVRFINGYGPTETSIMVSGAILKSGAAISIGKPIPNVNCYILDDSLQPVPIGIAGELYVGGAGVAKGYLNRPELTAERFLSDPFCGVAEAQMYRTGDRVRWMVGGDLEYLGRIDDQVKFKGYRIELAEIEAAMNSHPGVEASVVIAKKEALIGFVTPASMDAEAVRHTISKILPFYMVPAVIIPMKVFPTTTNGKIDKVKLHKIERAIEVGLPTTDNEILLANIWATVLNVQKSLIGIHTSFFELGGDSISTIILVSKARQIGIQITTADVFERPILAELAKVCVRVSPIIDVLPVVKKLDWSTETLQEIEHEHLPNWGLRPCDIEDVYRATPLQSAFILALIREPQEYLIQQVYEIEGELDEARLKAAWDKLTKCNPILRTKFATTSAGIFQILTREMPQTFQPSVEWDPATAEEEEKQYLSADRIRGFTLQDASLTRLTIAHIRGTDRYRFSWTLHHSIADGWSVSILIGDLLSAYAGETLKVRPPFKNYIEYLAAQNEAKTEAFWRSSLANLVPSMPILLPNPVGLIKDEAMQIQTQTFSFPISNDNLGELRKKAGITMSILLRSAWAVTLRHYLRRDDLIFGFVVSGRDAQIEDVERMVGVLINTVPVRVQLDDSMTVEDLLGTLKAYHTASLPFSHAPLADIKRWSGMKNVSEAIFHSFLTFQNFPEAIASMGELPLSIKMVGTFEQTEFPLALSISSSGSKLDVVAQYNTQYMGASAVTSVLYKFNEVLTMMCDTSRSYLTIGSLNKLSKKDSELFQSFGIGPKAKVPYECLHHAFEEQARLHSSDIAIKHGVKAMIYSELDARANLLAQRLRSIGVTPGINVGLLITRSIEMVVGLLAILKAGGSYVPIDHAFPKDRITYILGEASCSIVVTTAEIIESTHWELSQTCILIDDVMDVDMPKDEVLKPAELACGSDPAYIVFTSGTTGKPKGVVVQHRAILSSVHNAFDTVGVAPGLSIAQFMAVGFDGAVAEIFAALSKGATLVLREEDVFQTIKAVDILVITPTGLLQVNPEDVPRLKTVILAGEACPPSLIKRWGDKVCLFNAYGPTETAVMASLAKLELDQRITIGRPVSNVSCYILDATLQPVPIGIAGELYVGGAGVAKGYLNRPELTAERFLPDPFSIEEGARMYRTGDLARFIAPSGDLEYLGRVDSQIKLKGYRIELEEVAATMNGHPGVMAAVALVKKDVLVGFVTPASIDINELRRTVVDFLPSYMVPAVFVALDSFPTTTNGKVDKNQLLEIDIEVRPELPTTEKQRLLTEIVASILNVDRSVIGINTSFFALGGDSISAIAFVAACKRNGLSLTVAQLFKNPVIAQLATVATFESVISRRSNRVEPVFGAVPLTPIQQWFFETPYNHPNQFNQSWLLIPRDRVDIGALRAAIGKIVHNHDMLRATYRLDEYNRWMQTIPSSEDLSAINVRSMVVSNVVELEAKIKTISESLSLTNGPLYAVVLFEMGDIQKIFFTVHHLAIDLVSWRIIIDDLEILLNGGSLQEKSTSFQEWALALEKQAATFDSKAWNSYVSVDPLNPFAIAQGKGFSPNCVTVELDSTISSLLNDANSAYRTSTQDLILVALISAFHTVTGKPALSMILEGHGREPWREDLDISRTVGWFTSTYPVTFRSSHNVAEGIKTIKEILRSIPDKGLSYGAIKYLAPATESNTLIKHHADIKIGFNYLGRFQNFDKTNAFFTVDHDIKPWNIADDEQQPNINLSCMFSPKGCLSLDISFDASRYDVDLLTCWANQWAVDMTAVVDHCTNPTLGGGFTISDFSLMKSAEVLHEIEHEHLTALQIAPRQVEDVYPATPLQTGFVLSLLMNPEEYTVQQVFDIKGNIDEARLRASWAAVTSANTILRTAFASTSKGIFQIVLNTVPDNFEDTVEWDEETLEGVQEKFLRADRRRGFGITDTSFNRFTIAHIKGTDHYRLIWTIHHCIADGWCLPILVSDLLSAYAGDVLEVRPAFKIHIQHLTSQDKDDDTKAFWMALLEDFTPSIPISLPEFVDQTEEMELFQMYSCSLAVSYESLNNLCKNASITMSNLLRSAWAVVLRHYLRRDDVIFGSVLSGRDGQIEEVEKMVGVLINTIPVRVQLSGTMTVKDLLHTVQNFHSASIPFSHTPLADIKRWTGTSATESLFHTFLTFQNFPEVAVDKNKLPFSIETIGGYEMTEFPLTLTVSPSKSTLDVTALFHSRIISRSAVTRVLDKLGEVLALMASAEGSSLTVSDLDQLSFSDAQLFNTFGLGAKTSTPYECLHHPIEEQARIRPSAIAVEHEGKTMTYGELDARANALAHRLRAVGVAAGVTVGLFIVRSIEMIVGILAILKAGGIYVTTDAAFPMARITYIFDEAACKIVLTISKLSDRIPKETGRQCVFIDEVIDRQLSLNEVTKPKELVCGNDAAYVIFTSGTTGKPKGIVGSHRGATAMIHHGYAPLGAAPGLRVAQFMAIGFDVAAGEVFTTLSNGATLILRGEDAFETIKAVDILMITPTGLQQVNPEDVPRLKVVMVAGEACPPSLVERWGNRVRLHNGFGPGETGLMTTMAKLEPGRPITVGGPCPNVACYILDDNTLQPVPIGVMGGLYIGGLGVTLGYVNRPALTAERFIPDPFSNESGALMYRSGDMVRWNSFGELEYLGRTDDQVKVKGYRIELDEVAAAINNHPGVQRAVAIVKKDTIVGLFIPATIDVDAIRDTVASFLPSYMIPAVFVGLDAFPMTHNGKIDKNALKEMEFSEDIQLPITEAQKQMAEVWSTVLNVDMSRIGIHTSFFELGGDSISAIRLVAACKKAGFSVDTAQVFKTPTLAKLAMTTLATFEASDKYMTPLISSEMLETIERDFYPSIGVLRDEVEDVYPATPLQVGMLLGLMKDRSKYVVSLVWEVVGDLTLERVEEAWVRLLIQHSLLRTRFISSPEGIFQIVLKKPQDAKLSLITWNGSHVEEECAAFIKSELARGFSIEEDHFRRLTFIRVAGTNRHRLILTLHHSIYDGWSLGIIYNDLISALCGHDLRTVPLFRRHVEFIHSKDPQQCEEYWRGVLGGLMPSSPISLPVENGWAKAAFQSVPYKSTIPLAILTAYTKASKTTLSIVVKAAWALLLRQYLSREDVIFGNVITGRDVPIEGIERMVGMLMNTIPVRAQLKGDMVVSSLLESLQNTHASALPYGHVSLVDIHRWAGITGGDALFHTLMVFQNLRNEDPIPEKLPFHIEQVSGGGDTAEYNLNLTIGATETGLAGDFTYDTSMLNEEHVHEIINHFDFIIKRMVGQSATSLTLRELNALSPEQTTLFNRFGMGPVVPIAHECLHNAFEKQALIRPEAVAVDDGVVKLTYLELDIRANALARRLRSIGVAPGVTVGVFITRSIEMIVGILAVLKSGGAYVPVSAQFPKDRVRYMYTEANCKAILTVTSHLASVPEGMESSCIFIDEFMNRDITTEEAVKPDELAHWQDTAYIIFTSGSTGKPKGVVMHHRGVINLVQDKFGNFGAAPGLRVAQVLAVGFDGAVGEIFAALSNGATLVLREDDAFATIKTVDLLKITPTGLQKLTPEDYPLLKTINMAGEPCSRSLVDLWGDRVRLVNCYGPTETSVTAAFGVVKPGGPITVGRPINNVNFYILDASLQPVPIGAAGELFIGGVGVAKGYLNRPDLTAERFLADPFGDSGGQMYRSGDQARWWPNGELEILGRKDNQVKLKGYRIELDEVAAAMNSHPGVQRAVAVVKNEMIVGFFTPATVNSDNLRDVVAGFLPSYMVPAIFVGLEIFPTNVNGKIDKAALEVMEINEEIQLPTTETQLRLAEVWASVLNVDVTYIGIHTSFFELGGDSFSAIRLVAACKKAGFSISTAQVFETPTLAKLATTALAMETLEKPKKSMAPLVSSRTLEMIKRDFYPSLGVLHDEVEDVYPVTPLQGGMILALMRDPSKYVANSVWEVVGDLDEDQVQAAWTQLIKQHSILRTLFVSSPDGLFQVVLREPRDDKVALVTWSEDRTEHDCSALIKTDILRGFSIEEGHLRRLTLARVLGTNRHRLILTIHHSIYDGWSRKIICDDLISALAGHSLKERPHYKQYVEFIQSKDPMECEKYWRRALCGLIPSSPITLPIEKSKTKNTLENFLYRSSVSLATLQAYCRTTKTTLSNVVKATWALVLRHYLRRDDVIFGNVITGRDVPIDGIEGMVGMLINTIPVRAQMSGDMTVNSFLDSLQSAHAASLPYGHVSLVDLQRWAGVTGGDTLFHTMMVFQNLKIEDTIPEKLPFHIEQVSDGGDTHEYSLFLDIGTTEAGLEGAIAYDKSLLNDAYVQEIMQKFDGILKRIVQQPADSLTLKELNDLSAVQMELFQKFVRGPTVDLQHHCLHSAFEATAAALPDLIAVEHEEMSLTYGELDARSNILACRLRALGVKPGANVGLVITRSVHMIVGIMATLKAGGAYVPIDEKFPKDRISYMLTEAACDIVLTTLLAQASVPDQPICQCVLIEDIFGKEFPLSEATKPDELASREDTAYIIFTSGTTGKPKGVMVPHRSAAALFEDNMGRLGAAPGLRASQFMAIGFDAAVGEIFSALSHGATLVLRGEDPFKIVQTLDLLTITPTGLQQFEPDECPRLKQITLMGEAIPTALVDKWADKVLLVNGYGPTETTVISTTAVLKVGKPVTIGKPLSNQMCYVLDSNLKPVPIGVGGELVIGGIGVTKGYINRPELTAEKFILDPFSNEKGARMYRTGDQARFLKNGEIEYFGRIDDQVKLKGYRIELDEVVAAMNAHPGVQRAVALVKDDVLVGFFTPAVVNHDDLRETVTTFLPPYMVPAVLVGVDAFPMTVNGKIDRSKLKEIVIDSIIQLPTTKAQIRLAEVWASVLDVDIARIGLHTSFFELGGDSFSAIRLVAACKKAGFSISTAQVFETPTLAKLAVMVASAQIPEKPSESTISLVSTGVRKMIEQVYFPTIGVSYEDVEDIYPVTPLQAGMIMGLMRDQSKYVTNSVWEIIGDLDEKRVQAAWTQLIRQHSILRTRFVSLSEGLFQVVLKEPQGDTIARITWVEDGVEDECRDFLETDLARGFSIEEGHLHRLTLAQISGTNRHRLILTIHHSIYDGWSYYIILGDLFTALCGRSLKAGPLYRKHVEFIQSQDAHQSELYWRNALAGLVPSSPIILPIENSEADTFADSIPYQSTVSLSTLQAYCKAAKTTLATVIKAAWALVLRRYLSRDDIIFGNVMTGRDIPVEGVERMVGMLIHTIPVRAQLSGDMTVASLTDMLQNAHASALSYGHVGLVDIRRWAGISGGDALFHTMMVFQNLGINDTIPEKLPFDYKQISGRGNTNEYNLSLSIGMTEASLTGTVKFDPSMLNERHVHEIMNTFDHIIKRMVEQSATSLTLRELNALSPEQTTLFNRFGMGPVVPIVHECLHNAFEKQALIRPEAVAVDDGVVKLTYLELDIRANALARRLRSIGVAPGVTVGLFITRSIEMIVGILAVLKSGGAYVPVSAQFPKDRVRYMYTEANCKVILTVTSHLASVPEGMESSCIFIDEFMNREITTEEAVKPDELAHWQDMAYIIFTSGSTGKPKGVVMHHRGVINLVQDKFGNFGAAPGLRVAQVLAVGFDGAVGEIFAALSNGATLVLREDDAFATIKTVDLLKITPTGLQKLTPEDYPLLKTINMAGEPCSRSLVDLWGDRVRLVNCYGPTETSVTAAFGVVKPGGPITVGRPINNVNFYILDASLQPVPIGAAGELFIGGVGVAKGYLNRPDLTAERFLADPFGDSGGQMYRSGDQARWWPNGELEILGRKDNQVKLKGYRIELDEVAAAMNSHPGVQRAVAVVKNEMIVGFFTPATVNSDDLRNMVSSFLPSYMVPAIFVGLEIFPTNVNGKIDKAALEVMEINEEIQLPTTRTQRQISEVWSSVLDVDVARIGIHTSFFDLGGDSFSAIRLVAQLKRDAGVTLSLPAIFQRPTLAAMAEFIDGGQRPASFSESSSLPTTMEEDGFNRKRRLRILCLHGAQTSGQILSLQLRALQRETNSEIEFRFIDGPIQTSTSYVSKYFVGPYFNWVPSTGLRSEDLERAVDVVTQHIGKFGKVDGLLGFSQGATMVELIDRMAAMGKLERSWNFSILINGRPLPKSLPPPFSFKSAPPAILVSPSVHVRSPQDKIFRKSVELEGRYDPAMSHVLEHGQGHRIPLSVEFAQSLAEKIRAVA